MSWRRFFDPRILRARARPLTAPRYRLGPIPLAEWNDALMTSCQVAGPVLVRKGELVVGTAPWHTRWEIEQTPDGPRLYLLDILNDFQPIGIPFEPGTWDAVHHES